MYKLKFIIHKTVNETQKAHLVHNNLLSSKFRNFQNYQYLLCYNVYIKVHRYIIYIRYV